MGRDDSSPLPFQCVYTHPDTPICVNIIAILELGIDDVNQFVDLDANVITSLLVVFHSLVQN